MTRINPYGDKCHAIWRRMSEDCALLAMIHVGNDIDVLTPCDHMYLIRCDGHVCRVPGVPFPDNDNEEA